MYTCFGNVWPFWCWCAVKIWYHSLTSNMRHCQQATFTGTSALVKLFKTDPYDPPPPKKKKKKKFLPFHVREHWLDVAHIVDTRIDIYIYRLQIWTLPFSMLGKCEYCYICLIAWQKYLYLKACVMHCTYWSFTEGKLSGKWRAALVAFLFTLSGLDRKERTQGTPMSKVPPFSIKSDLSWLATIPLAAAGVIVRLMAHPWSLR